jgi:hypothetical protein
MNGLHTAISDFTVMDTIERMISIIEEEAGTFLLGLIMRKKRGKGARSPACLNHFVLL